MTRKNTTPPDVTDGSLQIGPPSIFYKTPNYGRFTDDTIFPKLFGLLALYGSSLLSMLTLLPILATLATVCLYFALEPLKSLSGYLYWQVPVIGFFAALLATFILAMFRSPTATSEGSNIQGYNMLKSGQYELSARLNVQLAEKETSFCVYRGEVQDTFELDFLGRQSEAALLEAYGSFHAIYESFSSTNGTQWVKGTGYVYTWGLIHRAEEALMEVDALPIVIREVIRDRFDLDGSNIGNRDELMNQLLMAVTDLDPDAIKYFKSSQANNRIDAFLGVIQNHKIQVSLDSSKNENDRSAQDKSPELDKPAQPDSRVQARARGALRQVKHQLNKFREDRLAELIQARNNLVLSIIATGSITYILLVIASLTNTPPVTLAGAVTYYIIGAVVGLFGRLYNESITGSAINDYGLSLSRLMAVPLLSGLAAIGGIFLIAALPAANGTSVPTLQSVFTLTPYYLVIAAVFGFTPNLLIKGLQARSDKIVSDLESARPGGVTSSSK